MDIYNCTVDYLDDNSNVERSSTFSHQLDIVSAPIFWSLVTAYYKAPNCDYQEIRMLQDVLPKWVASYACPICETHNVSVTCLRGSRSQNYDYNDGFSTKEMEVKLSVLTQGLEEMIQIPNPTICPLTCIESLHLKMLEILSHSFEALLAVPST